VRVLQAEFKALMLVNFSQLASTPSTVLESGDAAPFGRKLQQQGCSTPEAANTYASISPMPSSVDWVSGFNTGLSGGKYKPHYLVATCIAEYCSTFSERQQHSTHCYTQSGAATDKHIEARVPVLTQVLIDAGLLMLHLTYCSPDTPHQRSGVHLQKLLTVFSVRHCRGGCAAAFSIRDRHLCTQHNQLYSVSLSGMAGKTDDWA
jgi:hypothetical protein